MTLLCGKETIIKSIRKNKQQQNRPFPVVNAGPRSWLKNGQDLSMVLKQRCAPGPVGAVSCVETLLVSARHFRRLASFE